MQRQVGPGGGFLRLTMARVALLLCVLVSVAYVILAYAGISNWADTMIFTDGFDRELVWKSGARESFARELARSSEATERGEDYETTVSVYWSVRHTIPQLAFDVWVLGGLAVSTFALARTIRRWRGLEVKSPNE